MQDYSVTVAMQCTRLAENWAQHLQNENSLGFHFCARLSESEQKGWPYLHAGTCCVDGVGARGCRAPSPVSRLSPSVHRHSCALKTAAAAEDEEVLGIGIRKEWSSLLTLSLPARPARRRPWIPIPILPPPAPDAGHGRPRPANRASCPAAQHKWPPTTPSLLIALLQFFFI